MVSVCQKQINQAVDDLEHFRYLVCSRHAGHTDKRQIAHGAQSMSFFSTCQDASVHRPQLFPTSHFAAAASPRSCHFSHATVTAAALPALGSQYLPHAAFF